MNPAGLSRGAIRLVLALSLAAALPGHACTPPPLVRDAGFVRAHVDHLPKNARGVVFLPASGIPRAEDFRLVSQEDSRALSVRVRRIGDGPWVRIEPAGGFQPRARYLFRYLPAHPRWRYADTQTVSIADLVVDTAGNYAIEPAPQAVNRVVTVPANASCTKPVPVVLQEFGYAIPPSVHPYRNVLHYDVAKLGDVDAALIRHDPIAIAWVAGDPPAIASWLSFDKPDRRMPRDAAIAACGNQWRSVAMRASVSFPELEDRRHHTPEVTLDLSRGASGGCEALGNLLDTLRTGAPETVMRQTCRLSLGHDFATGAAALSTIPVDDFERNLEFPVTEMTPTCELVALAHRWRGALRTPPPAFVRRIGAALQRGYAWVEPEKRAQTVHALVYLLDHLPERFHGATAPRLLRPILPLLVEELASARPRRPDELARLITAAGPLPTAMRMRLTAVSNAKTATAAHAHAIWLPSHNGGLRLRVQAYA